MSFLVCFRAKYVYCTSGTREPRLLGHETRIRTCKQERYTAALATGNSALACEDQTKVWRTLCEATARSEACGLDKAGLFAQFQDCRPELGSEVCVRKS